MLAAARVCYRAMAAACQISIFDLYETPDDGYVRLGREHAERLARFLPVPHNQWAEECRGYPSKLVYIIATAQLYRSDSPVTQGVDFLRRIEASKIRRINEVYNKTIDDVSANVKKCADVVFGRASVETVNSFLSDMENHFDYRQYVDNQWGSDANLLCALALILTGVYTTGNEDMKELCNGWLLSTSSELGRLLYCYVWQTHSFGSGCNPIGIYCNAKLEGIDPYRMRFYAGYVLHLPEAFM